MIKNKKNIKFDLNDMNFRKALTAFMIITIIFLGFTGYKINEIKARAFQVYLDKDSLGIVRSEEAALDIMNDIKKDLSNTYGAECVLDKELSFELTHAKDKDLIKAEELKEGIKDKIDFAVLGYSIVVNDEEVGAVKTEKDAKAILDDIKKPYVESLEGDIQEIKFVEDVKVMKKKLQVSDIKSNSDIIELIEIGTEKIKTHVIEVGESFWTVAKMYDTSVDELVDANPERDPKKLKPGDEIKLLVPTPKLTVATTEKIEYTKDTDFETIVETNDSMYKNQKKVKVEGIKGESHFVANVKKQNGAVVEEEILSEDVIKEPVNELVVQGTKELPKTMATGVLMMPTRGRFTSGYGTRWGRMHRGIDIAAAVCTPIHASDGGTVSFSGRQGTYGNMIEIDHGNGIKTRYAHCSKLLVSKGTKVYKGQHIANVGSTGRSTGPHVHLEVLVNGVHVNPSKYVK
jgi:murein DD-endopeptidase MepM/ murein hydrolase activator NlpD